VAAIVGHPGGRPMEVKTGSIEAIRASCGGREFSMQYGAPTERGNSGGPAFTIHNGQLVALHHSGDNDFHTWGRGHHIFNVVSALEDSMRKACHGDGAWQWGAHNLQTVRYNTLKDSSTGRSGQEFVGYDPNDGSYELRQHSERSIDLSDKHLTQSSTRVAQLREPTAYQKALTDKQFIEETGTISAIESIVAGPSSSGSVDGVLAIDDVAHSTVGSNCVPSEIATISTPSSQTVERLGEKYGEFRVSQTVSEQAVYKVKQPSDVIMESRTMEVAYEKSAGEFSKTSVGSRVEQTQHGRRQHIETVVEDCSASGGCVVSGRSHTVKAGQKNGAWAADDSGAHQDVPVCLRAVHCDSKQS